MLSLDLLIPAITAILAAIPTVYATVYAQNKKNKEEAKKDREDYSKELVIIIDTLKNRVNDYEKRIKELEQEKDDCDRRVNYIINILAQKGILHEVDKPNN